MRIQTIDSIKGLLIILVVFFHITFIGSAESIFSQAKDITYLFHMPIFLMISGYFLNLKKDNYLYILFRKFIFPYIAFYGFYLLSLYITGKIGIVPTSNSLNSLTDGLNYFLINPISSYWYLHSLIIFSLAIFIAEKLINNHSENQKIKLIIKIIIAASIILIIKMLGVEFYWWVFFSLSLGFLQKEINSALKFNPTTTTLLLFICIASYFLSIKSIYSLFLSILLYGLLHYYFSRTQSNVLAFLGRNSLIIFLLHIFPINAFKLLQKYFLYYDGSGITYAISSCSAALISCIFIGKLFDTINISKYVFGTQKIIK